MELSRNKVFGVGVVAILLFITINRVDFLIGSRFAKGEVIHAVKSMRGNLTATVQFQTSDGVVVNFYAEKNSELTQGQKVDVVYKTEDPQQSKVISFVGFVMTPMIYALFPLFLFSSVILGFLDKNDIVVIGKNGVRKVKPFLAEPSKIKSFHSKQIGKSKYGSNTKRQK